MEEKKVNKGNHQLTLVSRERLTLDGVTNVGSDRKSLSWKPARGCWWLRVKRFTSPS